MIDPDAPSAKNPIYQHWLHWLVINNDQNILSYTGPNPPAGSGKHRYQIIIYEQEHSLNTQHVKKTLAENNISETNRGSFNHKKFVERYRLKEITRLEYTAQRK